jgi:hypothetical protein
MRRTAAYFASRSFGLQSWDQKKIDGEVEEVYQSHLDGEGPTR